MVDSLVLDSTLSVLTLLFIATGVAFAFRKTKIPFAVILVLVGVLTGMFASYTGKLSFLSGFQLSPALIFYVFLPTLVFESAFRINFQHFRQSAQPILWLSTVGVLINMFLIGAGLHLLLDLPWVYALLFGALVSPTDPISVLALFKRLGAPPRLATIVEGESLINDGMALVLFEIMYEIVKHGGESFVFSSAAFEFSINVTGGILVGAFLGLIFSKALDYVKNSKEIEISITLLLAHFTFILADYFLGVSGILATVTAGLVVGNYGAYKISPEIKDIMNHFWDYMSFFANSLLFLIVGIMMWGVKDEIWPLIDSIGIAIAIVLFARIVMVYTILPLINIFIQERNRVRGKWIHIIQWSGLRGALVIALVLTLPSDMPFYNEILIISTGIVFFTIVFNGFTMEPLMSLLGLKRFSALENFAYDESKLFIDNKVLDKFRHMKKNKYITPQIYEQMVKVFNEDREKCKSDILKLVKDNSEELSNDQIREILKNYLLGIEKWVFLKLYYYGEVTQDILNILIQNLNLQIENIYTEKTPIGRLTLFNPEGFWVKLWEKLGFEGYARKIKRKEVMLRYEMYRARYIATDEVLETLSEMEDSDSFYEKSILTDFEKKYTRWNQNAESKLSRLELRDCEACKEVKLYLARQAAFKVEKQVVQNFIESGMIDEKIYLRLVEDMDLRYNKKRII